MNAHRDFHTWLSWFGNTGIDVSFSLRSSALLLPFLVSFCPSILSFFLFFLPVLTSLAVCYSFLLLLFWDRINSSQLKGRAMSGAHFQFPHPQAGPVCIHAHYGCYSGLIHGLISFCCEIPLPEHPVFLGAGHKTRRNLYMEISPAMGNISPYTCPHKRSTTSVIADSTWNAVTSPHFMTKHSLCHCPRVE